MNTFEDLIGSIEEFMNQAASHLVNREVLPKLYDTEGFYRHQLGRRRELVAKRKDWLRQGYLPSGGGDGLIRQIASVLCKGRGVGGVEQRWMERAHVTVT